MVWVGLMVLDLSYESDTTLGVEEPTNVEVAQKEWASG
jgi:hypothetical protein